MRVIMLCSTPMDMDNAAERCIHCGYDLRGHQGNWRMCPECGRWNDLAACEPPLRPLSKKWSNLAVGTAAAICVALSVFLISLRVNGYRLTDLWGGLNPRLAGMRAESSGLASVPPDVPKFAFIGLTLSKVCFCLAFTTCTYSTCVIIAAFGRRDRRTYWIAGLAMVLCVVAGILSMQIGFVIAGI
jgi:VanZ family protein